MTGSIGEKCDFCGIDNWSITTTMIECRSCQALWGRVNGQWVLAEAPKS